MTTHEAFTLDKQGDIAFLTIHSPHSTVNVFTRAAADQLRSLLQDQRVKSAKALVFVSSKPHSFFNGAELLMTAAVKSMDDIIRVTSSIRTVYDEVANLPIPTIAAINGNCFGCGMEFILCSDYRIAADSSDTYFYLTELVDYFMLPLFGSTFRLSPLVGLKNAVNMLVWGKEYSSAAAHEAGLVDRVLRGTDFALDLRAFLAELAKAGFPKRPAAPNALAQHTFAKNPLHGIPSLEKYQAALDATIAGLSPTRQALHRLCFEILLSNMQGASREASDKRLANTFATLATEHSRNATNFFFVKSMARAINVGKHPRNETTPIKLTTNSLSNPGWTRFVADLRFDSLQISTDSLPQSVDLIIDSNKTKLTGRVIWGYEGLLPTVKTDFLFYFPTGSDVKCAEIFIAKEKRDALSPFLALLDTIDWQVNVFSTPSASLVNVILHALRQTLKSYDPEESDAIVQEYGYERPISAILASFHKTHGSASPRIIAHTTRAAPTQPAAIEKWHRKVIDFVQAGLSGVAIEHPLQIELAMTRAFAYPITGTQFITYLKQWKK